MYQHVGGAFNPVWESWTTGVKEAFLKEMISKLNFEGRTEVTQVTKSSVHKDEKQNATGLDRLGCRMVESVRSVWILILKAVGATNPALR